MGDLSEMLLFSEVLVGGGVHVIPKRVVVCKGPVVGGTYLRTRKEAVAAALEIENARSME